jgi:hypothetical protein
MLFVFINQPPWRTKKKVQTRVTQLEGLAPGRRGGHFDFVAAVPFLADLPF